MGLTLATGDDGAQVINGVRMPTEIRLAEVAALLPYARNSKTHGPKQIAALCERIKSLGWTNPVLVADGTILAGHGRVLAAQKLGLARVPTIDCSHLTPTQRRELVIWDNRSGELDSGWDLEMLKLETDDLRAEGIDLEAALGFSEEDLAGLFEGMDGPPDAGGGDPDAVPPVPEHPVSQPGDVWICGPHRVCCGDSTDGGAWEHLLGSEMVDAVWTDPPYLVDVARKNRLMEAATVGTKSAGNRTTSGSVANDAGMTPAEFAVLLRGIFDNLFAVMKPGAPIYVAHSDKAAGIFRHQFEAAGLHFSQGLVWDKANIVLGVAYYQPAHEPVMYGWKPGSRHRWYGGRKKRTVAATGGDLAQQLPDGRWAIRAGDRVLIVHGDVELEELPSGTATIPKPARSELHPTTKPVALVEAHLRNSARPRDIVADSCAGSGTTLVAADRLGMCARLMELKPEFVDVIVTRWQMLTGRQAVHAVTGSPFGTAAPAPQAAAPDARPAGAMPACGALPDIF